MRRRGFDIKYETAGSASLWALPAVLLLSAMLATAKPVVVLAVLLGVAGLVWAGPFAWERCGRLLWRLKWFYLSLLVFFGVWPVETPEGPALAGLIEAFWRIGALALVVVLVVWLTERFSRGELVRALSSFLAGPRGCFGGWGERFAQRLFLALALFESDRVDIEREREGLRGGWRERLHGARDWLIVRLDRALSGEVPELATDAFTGRSSTVPQGGAGAVVWLWIVAVAVGGLAWWW
ncbi:MULTISPECIES: hypothetical protein [unclassified Thioalkalivibrio]|uniref:hypothetical protein n=1 Tax=unclassified Thioalkalivibrio TaxID=2621013 RepID=UPI0003678EA7|nr:MULTISPECIES: hypothetical protein [unclassified Thioalkalivibrio]